MSLVFWIPSSKTNAEENIAGFFLLNELIQTRKPVGI